MFVDIVAKTITEIAIIGLNTIKLFIKSPLFYAIAIKIHGKHTSNCAHKIPHKPPNIPCVGVFANLAKSGNIDTPQINEPIKIVTAFPKL